MRQFSSGIVSLLLAACLASDPVLASAFSNGSRAFNNSGRSPRIIRDRFVGEALASREIVSPLGELLGHFLSSEVRRQTPVQRRAFLGKVAAGIGVTGAVMKLRAVNYQTNSQTSAPPPALSDSPREFVDHVLRNHLGGIDKFIDEHDDLGKSVRRHPPELKERLTRAYVLFMFFRNGGFSGYQVSKRGHDIEDFIWRRIEEVTPHGILPLAFFFTFIEIGAEKMLKQLPEQFRALPQNEVKGLQSLFADGIKDTIITPYVAEIVLAEYFRLADVSDHSRVKMRKADSALLLRVRLDDKHEIFIHIDEDSSVFDVQDVGSTVDPTLAAFRRYELMQIAIDKHPSLARDREPGRIGKAIQSIAAYFYDPEFFSRAAELLASGLFLKETEIFYTLHAFQQERMIDLKNLHTSLEIKVEGARFLVRWPSRLITEMDRRNRITAANLDQRIKEFQAHAREKAQRIDDFLRASADLERSLQGPLPVYKKFGILFPDLRVAAELLEKIGSDPKAALLEFRNSARDPKVRKRIEKLLNENIPGGPAAAAAIPPSRTPHEGPAAAPENPFPEQFDLPKLRGAVRESIAGFAARYESLSEKHRNDRITLLVNLQQQLSRNYLVAWVVWKACEASPPAWGMQFFERWAEADPAAAIHFIVGQHETIAQSLPLKQIFGWFLFDWVASSGQNDAQPSGRVAILAGAVIKARDECGRAAEAWLEDLLNGLIHLAPDQKDQVLRRLRRMSGRRDWARSLAEAA